MVAIAAHELFHVCRVLCNRSGLRFTNADASVYGQSLISKSITTARLNGR
jgi:hypothetical protein